MPTKIFEVKELRDLKLTTIARKHGCSADYVSRVLTGSVERRSILSLKILTDATDMLAIINRETKITL